MRKLVTPFRVGLLVLTSGAFLFVFLSFIKRGGLSEHESVRVFAYFRDASGLGPKSKVQIAGIQVGEIQRIALEGTRAKVYLKIRKDVDVREDAILKKRSESAVLGDYVLDLYPGSEQAPLLVDGSQIKRVEDAPGMEAVLNSLTQITADVQQVTGTLREVLGGDKGEGSLQQIVENMIRLSDTLDQSMRSNAQKLSTIMDNFEGVSRDIRGITHENDEKIQRIVANIDFITTDARDVLATIKRVVGSGEGELSDSVASLKQTLAKLDASLQNVQEVTQNVKEGKGAVGALLNDERLGQKVSESVEDLSNFANTLTRLQLEVGVRSEYLVNQGEAKNVLGLRFIPQPDKYYLLELVDDPRGFSETVYLQTTPPSAGDPGVQQQRVVRGGIL